MKNINVIKFIFHGENADVLKVTNYIVEDNIINIVLQAAWVRSTTANLVLKFSLCRDVFNRIG